MITAKKNNLSFDITDENIEKFRIENKYKTNCNIYYNFQNHTLNNKTIWGMSVYLKTFNSKELSDSKKFNHKIKQCFLKIYQESLLWKGEYGIKTNSNDWRHFSEKMSFLQSHNYILLSYQHYQKDVLAYITNLIKNGHGIVEHTNDVLFLLQHEELIYDDKKIIFNALMDKINDNIENNIHESYYNKILYLYHKDLYFDQLKYMHSIYIGVPVKDLTVQDAIKTIHILGVEKIQRKSFENISAIDFVSKLSPAQITKYFGQLSFCLNNSSTHLTDSYLEQLEFLKNNNLRITSLNGLFKYIINSKNNVAETKYLTSNALDYNFLMNLINILQYSLDNNVHVMFKQKYKNHESAIVSINKNIDQLISLSDQSKTIDFYNHIKNKVNKIYKKLQQKQFDRYEKNIEYNVDLLPKTTCL